MVVVNFILVAVQLFVLYRLLVSVYWIVVYAIQYIEKSKPKNLLALSNMLLAVQVFLIALAILLGIWLLSETPLEIFFKQNFS